MNQTFMQFVSSTGTFTFDREFMPLIGRRVGYARQGDQGYAGNKRIDCTLNGFFYSISHKEVVDRYQALLAILKCNDAHFVYRTDDQTIIVDKQVYIDDYAEPVDWKQYSGEYSLAFHYFELPTHTLSDLGIQAVYSPSTGPPYTFNPVPNWSGSFKPNRPNWRGPRVTPSGQPLASETTVTLTGRLAADDHAALKNKVDALTGALQYDGTLNYGVWTNQVRVEDFQIPSTFPRNYVDYQIVLKYDSPGIIKFSSKRSVSRLHNHPKITELPLCGTVRTLLFTPLGQTINYYFNIQAMSIPAARTLLINEVQAMIFSGGIELEGGREEWDDSQNEVTLTCSKYYFPPVVNNLQGS